MRVEHWRRLVQTAEYDNDSVPLALIVDSPWVPDYFDISHYEYYLSLETWFDANVRLYEEFEDIIFVPGFWIEYGMAAEPSGFGGRISWRSDSTPVPHPVSASLGDLIDKGAPRPERDGLMPWVLWRYGKLAEKLQNSDHEVKMVAARGPLAIASWVRGVEGLLMDIKKTPDEAKKFLDITTELAINWLQAQIEALEDVEGILLLDDIVGFFSPEDYMEFCHPLLQRIFGRFEDKLRIYHNDSEIMDLLENMKSLDMDVFNFSHELDFAKVREAGRGNWALMGNIPPVDVLSRGSSEDVKNSLREMKKTINSPEGIIVSAGGGVAPDTPVGNIKTLDKVVNNVFSI